MRDIDRVQSMGEPPRRPPDQRAPSRPVKRDDEAAGATTADTTEPEPEPKRVGTIDLRV